ncbi:hypothetical protein ABIF26_006964 [Bradyrhizobium elkanii]|uniref:hypothetical protein n=1 Tax=Bradyrhizobium elkanii TaxID=29448 RepID=UPI003513BDF3
MKENLESTLKDVLSALRKFMPIDVFIGGNGDVVLVQEVTDVTKDGYLRLMVDFEQADALAEKIKEVVRAKRAAAS